MRALIAVLVLAAARLGALDVAVGAGVPSGEVLTRDVIRDIFLGRKATWADGVRIEIVVQKDGATHERFLTDVVGRSPSQFTYHWRNLLFTGRGRLPTVVADDAAMAEHLRQHPGAIGYLGDAPTEGIRRIPLR